MSRRLSALATAGLAVLAVLALLTPAHASAEAEAEFTTRANDARAEAGRSAYATRSDLVEVARRHAARMAAEGRIYHNPNLRDDVAGWRAVGENVGMGGSAARIHDAFMASPSHRANILDREFTEVGMGTAVDADGTLFVVQVFRLPMAASPSPAAISPATKPARRAPVATAARRPEARPTAAARPVRRAAAATPSAEAEAVLTSRLAAASSAAGSAVGLQRVVMFSSVMGTLAG